MTSLHREPIQFPTPKDEVDLLIYSLDQDISELFKMRMANRTADHVLAQSVSLSGLAQRLDALASDIHASVHKQEAAE